MPESALPTSDLHSDLARRAVDYMKLRSLKQGDHITEIDLAKSLNVSRSPIRGALRLLVEKGILIQEANKGCFVDCDPQTVDPDQFGTNESHSVRLYRDIASDYFNQDLPSEVAEAELLRRYEVGRAALANVLRQMFNDGLITRNPGKGWRFEPTLNTAKSHDDSYRLRLIIEPAAILEPSFALDTDMARVVRDTHLDILATGITTNTIQRVVDADTLFHDLIGISSGNMFIESVIKSQNRLRTVLEYQFHAYVKSLEKSCHEHLRILKSLEKKQQEKAAEQLMKHISRSGRARPEF